MKKIILYTFLFIVANVLLLLLLAFIGQNFITRSGGNDFSGLFYILIYFAISLVLELIVGGILATRTRTKDVGKGIMLSAAIILLFGLSVCSSMW